MIDITDIGPRYLQVYDNYDQFSESSNNYIKGEDHICYVIRENEVIYWIALENVWRPLNVVTTSAGTIEGIDNPVNVTLRTVSGSVTYTRVPNIPDAERIIKMDDFLANYPQIEYLDFTGNVNTTSMRNAFANSNIKDIGDINFDNVNDCYKLFENCTNFEEGHTITINTNATTFDANCIVNYSNLPNLIINVPNVNFGNLKLMYFNKLSTNYSINYNDTYWEYYKNYVSHNSNFSNDWFAFDYSDTLDYEIKCPVFVVGYYYSRGSSQYYYNGISNNISCEVFISKLNDEQTGGTVSFKDTQINISTKKVIFDYTVHPYPPKLTNSYNILFDNELLKEVVITNTNYDCDKVIYCRGIKIDLSKVKLTLPKDINSVLYHGFVFSGDNPITIDTINTFPEFACYGFPYFKDLELSELQDSNIDNTGEDKTFYCSFTRFLQPGKSEFQDKTKLGTHVFKNIKYIVLDITTIPNITLQCNSENHTQLIEVDFGSSAYNDYIVKTYNTFNIEGNFDIDTANSYIEGTNMNLFLGSGINFNNVTFNIVGHSRQINIYAIGTGDVNECDTVFDSKYDYTFSYSDDSTENLNVTYFYINNIGGPQFSIDKLARQNVLYSSCLAVFTSNLNTRFLYAKYNEDIQIYITSGGNNQTIEYLDFYYKYFNNELKPIIINKGSYFNCNFTAHSENSDIKQTLIDISSGMYTEDCFTDIEFFNQQAYNEYLEEATTMYIDCTDEGWIPFNIVGYATPDRYYDFYVGYCRRINNLQYIYGNVVLKPSIHWMSVSLYNSIREPDLYSLTRDFADGIISHEQGNKENSKSLLKHIDVTKALKGYWDIRFMPNLDQETVKAIVNNLEAWDGEDKQDFNLYRSQWDLLSSEHQSMLSTKNYNVRITEDAPPQQITFYNGGVYVSQINWSIGSMVGSRSIRIFTNSINNGEFAPYTVAVQNTGGVDISSAFIITYETNLTGTTSMPYNSAFTIKYNGVENPSNVVWNAVATQTGTDFSQTLILNIS